MTPTESKLIEVLTKGLKLRTSFTITPETQIFSKTAGGLGLDSVDVLEIAVLLDKHFGVDLDDEAGGGAEVRTALASISSLAAYIDSKKV